VSKKQIPFAFYTPTNFNPEDFIVSSANLAAFRTIESWPNWGQGSYANMLLLHGKHNAGKSHLAYIWQLKSNAKHISPEHIANTDNSANIVLEDIDLICNQLDTEIFHLINRFYNSNSSILFTSTLPAQYLDIKLPDLRSRLNALPEVSIGMPDEELLKAVLIKLFTDKQIRIDLEVINFIISRIDRSFDAIHDIVNKIDAKSLQEKRHITIPLIKDLINIQSNN
jgi:chromosomal replication initiation ATPase DnaA